MSDVTAVILSIGEPYTARAVASVERQTLPAAETILVSGTSPFHRALNEGAARVRTRYFVQVDADMILDDTCFAELRSRADDSFGLVSALLRDPVVGRLMGIRMYLTECFQRVQIRDSISPDMDFTNDAFRHGWSRQFVLRYAGLPPELWHTLGDHRPDYTLPYAFCKFVREGIRARYRRREGRVRAMFEKLRRSDHDIATVALIAFSHGLFLRDPRDLLVPSFRTPEVEILDAFLASAGPCGDLPGSWNEDCGGDLRKCFQRAFESGLRARQESAAARFLNRLAHLKRNSDIASWMAIVAMCHGLFCARDAPEDIAAAYASLDEILAEGPPCEIA